MSTHSIYHSFGNCGLNHHIEGDEQKDFKARLEKLCEDKIYEVMVRCNAAVKIEGIDAA
jgi:hypothetical protein